MENSCIKKLGTREEVYKSKASRTAGGLCKEDIIEKLFNGKLIYISKKISEKMKAQMTTNPMFNKIIMKKQKNKNKKTISNPSASIPSASIPSASTQSAATPSASTPIVSNKHKAKTQKLSFEINKNEFKNVYYPELKGLDLKELKEELLREEAEEDNPCGDLDFDFDLKEVDDFKPNRSGSGNVKKSIDPFTIEELPDIDINSL